MFTGPAVHAPDRHTSAVHRFESTLHDVLSGWLPFVHTPVEGEQYKAPDCLHGFDVGHVFTGPAVHTPERHTSAVHRFPSTLHDELSGWLAFVHKPVADEQNCDPDCLHGFPLGQEFTVPTHTPPEHTSPVVHRLLSVHAVPFADTAQLTDPR